MMRDTIVRFSIPFREAMSALLAGEQIDADSYEIRVLNGCVVVDLINPVQGSPLPVRQEEDKAEEDQPLSDEEVSEAEDGPETLNKDPEAPVDSRDSPPDEPTVEDSGEEPFYRSEDEEPKAPENDEEASQRGSKGRDGAKPRQGANAQRAGILCTEGRFQVFMDEEGNEDGCAKAVRQTCGVTSRRELDTDPKAKREWERLLSEYEEWCRT